MAALRLSMLDSQELSTAARKSRPVPGMSAVTRTGRNPTL